MTTRLYLIRHGETEWNRDGNRYCGSTDIGLSPHGKEQAEQLANRMREVPLDRIYASSLQRAYETALPLATGKRLPVGRDGRIAEIEFGLWEGLRFPDIYREHRDAWDLWERAPDEHPAGTTGETAARVYERTSAFVREKAEQHAGEGVAVVSHSTTLRIFVAGMLGMPLVRYRQLAMANAAVTLVEAKNGQFRLIHYNVTDRLV